MIMYRIVDLPMADACENFYQRSIHIAHIEINSFPVINRKTAFVAGVRDPGLHGNGKKERMAANAAGNRGTPFPAGSH